MLNKTMSYCCKQNKINTNFIIKLMFSLQKTLKWRVSWNLCYFPRHISISSFTEQHEMLLSEYSPVDWAKRFCADLRWLLLYTVVNNITDLIISLQHNSPEQLWTNWWRQNLRFTPINDETKSWLKEKWASLSVPAWKPTVFCSLKGEVALICQQAKDARKTCIMGFKQERQFSLWSHLQPPSRLFWQVLNQNRRCFSAWRKNKFSASLSITVWHSSVCLHGCFWNPPPPQHDFWEACAILSNFHFWKKKNFFFFKIYFHPTFFWHFWMFYTILSTSQILVKIKKQKFHPP